MPERPTVFRIDMYCNQMVSGGYFPVEDEDTRGTAQQEPEDNLDVTLQPRRRRLNFGDIGNYLPKRFSRFVAPLALSVAALSYGGATCGGEDEAPKSSELQQRLTYSLTLPFAAGEQLWYSVGPHYDENSSSRVRYAVDLTPVENPRACPGSGPFMERPVRAIAAGRVEHVGDEDNKNDKYHSVVEIDHGESFTSGYMHLDETEVYEDQFVSQGQVLGYVSCEYPPGGGTDGQHLHFYGKIDGKPIEIDRVVMSGWTIVALEGNKKGLMYVDPNDESELRTADTRRCGPQTYSIRQCDPEGRIRNDISWSELGQAELAPTVAPVPTRPSVATIAPVPTLPVIPTIEATPTPELNDNNEGVISTLGWDFRIKSWGEEPDYEYGGTSTLHEGWKRVVVEGDLTNVSGNLSNTGRLRQYFGPGGVYYFAIEGSGFTYEAKMGRRPSPYQRLSEAYQSLEKLDVPDGLSVPFLIVAEVPNTVADYDLMLYDERDGSTIGGPVDKGEVYGKSRTLPDDRLSAGETCEVEGYASIEYAGDQLFSATTIANGNFEEQYLMFDVTNKWGNDIQVGDSTLGLEVAVFASEGSVHEATDGGYSDVVQRTGVIAPGLRKRIFRLVGTDGADEVVSGNLTNLNGAVVSLTIWNDATESKNECKWQLP